MRDLELSVSGGETRVVARAQIVESPLSKQRPDSARSGVHRREAVGRQENEETDEEDEEKKEEEVVEEAGVEETREGRQRQGGGNFLGARSRTKGARNVRL